MQPVSLNKPNSHALSKSGFTLIEMLLVLVILSILAGIIYPNIGGQGLRARITATHVQLDTFQSTLNAFEMDNDHFPKGHDGLTALVQRPRDAKNWRGPYVKEIPKDPWGHDYLYECPGRHNRDAYDISSAGPDGIPGTEDDIYNWPVGR